VKIENFDTENTLETGGEDDANINPDSLHLVFYKTTNMPSSLGSET
jgi:hypothetical protein